MFVITISKKVAAITAAVLALVAIGTIVLVASNEGPHREAASAAATEGATPVCAPTTTTPPEIASASAPSPGNRSTGSSGSRSGPSAVEESPYYPTFADAIAATDLTQRWRYDATTTVADTTTTATGAVDLSTDSVSVVGSTGSAATEFRRVGDTIYVNARRLGSSGATWVAVDAATQVSQLSGRAVHSLVSSLSPNFVMAALHFPMSIDLVGNDKYGAHFSVGIAGPSSNLLPLLDIFGTTTDPSSAVIDVWINSDGRVSRLAFANDRSSVEFSLHEFGQDVDTAAPAPNDVGGVNSTSGTFLFGPALSLAAQGAANHSLTIDPSVEFVDGIVRGALHATSATGEQMRYVFLGSGSGGKLDLGTVTDGPLAGPQSFTVLPYANWLEYQSKGTQSFDVRVREATEIGRRLTSMPFIGSIAQPVIDLLQDDPTLAARLAPVIGVAATTQIGVDVNALAPGNTPLAFTRKVMSFDGTPISTNFFPASGLSAGATAPLALLGSALGTPGATNPYAARIDGVVPGPAYLRSAPVVGDVGYNVITWDPRGEFASGGVLQLDNPFFEGRDVSAIIDFAAYETPTTLNGASDPAVGMVGASYGGSIQLVVGSTDPRIDAIVPVAAVNSLVTVLQPGDLLHSAAASTLLAGLNAPHVTANDQLRQGLADGLANGYLSESTRALLSTNTMTPLLQQLQAPTLLLASTTDPFLPLSESIANAQVILNNPYGTPTKIAWFDGAASNADVAQTLMTYTKAWLNKYVAGVPIPDAFTPTFQWWDQNGTRVTSNLYPFDPGFNLNTPIEATSTGGTLTISPNGGPITAIPVPASVPAGTRIAGAPSVTFTYRGTGNATTVFARIVDPATGRTLSSRPTPIPVILDGQSHTVSVPLDDIVFTANGAATLDVEIASGAIGFPTPASGQVSISAVVVDLPVIA